VEQQ
jgi:hypothetical protein